MAEFVAATAAELLEGVASVPAQAEGQSVAEWLAEAQFQRIVQEAESAATNSTPVYRWNFDPALEDAFSKVVDETGAEGAWEAWKDGGGNVSPTGSASPSPTSTASPQTAINAGSGATAGGLLSMSLPTWVAAAAPLLGVAVGVGLYEASPTFWEKVSRALLPFCYDDTEVMPVVTDEDGNTYIDKEAVEALKGVFVEEGVIVNGKTSDLDTGWPDGVPSFSELTFTYEDWDHEPVTVTYTNPEGGLIGWAVARPRQGGGINWGYEVVKYADHEVTGWNSFTHNNKTVWWSVTSVVGNGESLISSTFPIFETAPNTHSKESAWTAQYGTEAEGEFPDGTSKWSGDTVDIGTLPTIDVYTKEDGTESKPYIPVALPTTPGQSLDPEENPDPTTNEDPERQISPYILPNIPKSQFPDGSEIEDKSDDAPIPSPIPNQNPKPDTDANPSQPSDKPPTGQIVDVIPPFDIGDLIPPDSLPTSPGGAADGGVGGLVSVYNPTYAELSAFAQWLWVTYADATIDKIWNNPFDGIISLHEFYADPDTGGRKYIKSGFLVSPVESDTVPNRYTEINCGTAIFPEYYGNYLDYSPYSKALVYLPFIGIEELNVDDIVGHAVNITYRVDSYSGACIALISCAKEGSNAIFYQFCGNCSVQLPIAGGTQAAIKAAQISAGAYQNAYHVAGVAGLAGGIASGVGSLLNGNIGGLLGSAVNGIGSYMVNQAQGQANSISQTVSAKSSVQHSGQFGESFGAMGNKKPFMIIKRPVQVRVPNYQAEYGYPAHKYVTIGDCEGFLRCRGVHVTSARATDEERQLIEKALTEGVFVT